MCLGGLQVEIDLSRPPRVRQAAYGVHGATRRIERYLLPDLWCLHLYAYRATLEVREHTVTIEPGMITLIPADTEMTYRFRGASQHLYAHFAVEANDATAPELTQTALAHPLGKDSAAYRHRLERIVELQVAQPRHADALLWSLLWDLTGRRYGSGTDDALPAVLADAIGFIDARMHQPIKVRDIADHVGYSHNHLTRLFREHLDTTVIAFLRARRMQRARHLLVHSDRTIGDIGGDVGLPDPQRFNKTFRQFYGRSPTAQRRLGDAVE